MSPIDPGDFQLSKLISKIQTERGFDFTGFRRAYAARRVDTRLTATGTETLRDYMRRLDSDPGEYPKLLDALTVNVSEFFRDKTVWRYLKDTVVPEIVGQKVARGFHSIRVWSAGCSTGQEPYSIAMLVLEELEKQRADLELSVTATDIDRMVIAFGKTGRYPMKHLPQIPPRLRHKYVSVDGEEFEMAPRLKGVVKFRMLDIFADNPISAVDLIICRNVMIYFDRKKQVDVYEKLVKALRKGGFLVIGRSEKIASDVIGRLTTRDLHERVYQAPY
jgi:chemotaxis methyl-accepting protein methylase